MRHPWLPRALFTGLAVPAAMAAVTTGAFLAGAGPAAAATGGAAGTGCTDTWTGGGPKVLWNIAQNWSTGKVPGHSSDVCLSAFVFVTANGAVSIHSLHLGGESTVVFAATPGHPSHVTIATTLDNQGNVELDNSSLTAPQVNNTGGIEDAGTSVLTSAALHNGGTVDAVGGSLTLPDSLAQLSNGTLTGGSWLALNNGVLALPGDIATLASGLVSIGTGSAIHDQAGNNALAGLTSAGPQATLAVSGSLALSGSLVSAGTLEIGGYDGGGTLTVAGTLTESQNAMAMAAQSTVTATTVHIDRGSLSASGTIDGNLVNDGFVEPASRLAVTGSYTQGTGGTLDAGFVTELQVAGKATLAGALTAGATPPPAPGTRGTAITFGSRSGGFTTHNLGFNLVALAHRIDVTAQTQVAASPATVARGATATMSGGDFGYRDTVTLFLDQVGGRILGTAQAGFQGEFSTGFTVPWIPAGTHTIIAVGSSGRQAQTTITVT